MEGMVHKLQSCVNTSLDGTQNQNHTEGILHMAS